MVEKLPTDLPALPQAAARILEMLKDPEVSVPQLARAVEFEPGIALKLFRFCNSSFVGATHRITDLQHALAYMGLQNAKMTTLGFCLTNIFPLSRDFDFNWCWQRNAMNAAVARRLARETSNVKPEDAFLGGVIQDAGLLLRGESLGAPFQRLIDACRKTGQPIELLERQAFGNDHAEISARMVDHWGFPAPIGEGVRGHHRPDDASPLGVVLGAAESLSNFILKNTSDNLVRYRQSIGRLGIDEKQADGLVGEFEPLVLELADVLNVSLTLDHSFAQLVAEAQQQLVAMSIQAATDLTRTQQEAEQLRQFNRSLQEEAYQDDLTGLGNRRKFDLVIAAEIEQAAQMSTPMTLIMCDIDRFKSVNDTYGHSAGDLVLSRIGRAVKQSLREDDTACRYGGEELAIIQPGTKMSDALLFADRLRVKISRIEFPPGNFPKRVTASFGLTTYSGEQSITPEQLVNAADTSLYAAKEAGRNCVKARRI